MTNPSKDSAREQPYLRPALDITVRLLLLALILGACFMIARPFLMPLVWGIVIAVAFHAPFVRFTALLGGRRKLAGIIFIVLGLALVIGPTAWLGQSGVKGAMVLGRSMQDGTLAMPAMPDNVKEWPVVGETIFETYTSASHNLRQTLARFTPQLQGVGKWLVQTIAAFGTAILYSLLAIIIAGVVLIRARFGADTARNLGLRLGGERGARMVEIAGVTIASVFKGVVLVALIQGTLAGVGFFAVGLPRSGLWALLVIAVAVIQVPTGVILGPAIFYVFSTNDSTAVAVIFTIWSVVVMLSDNFLKPIFLGRGVKSPMLVILFGAIGGMIAFGILGLFLGAVILAIGYELLRVWLEEHPLDEASTSDGGASGT